MNKRVIAAAIIAAIVVLFGVTAVVTTCIIADDVIADIEKLQSNPNETEALEQFITKWEKQEKILSFYTRHSEIENITSSVELLKCKLNEDEALFRIECQEIIAGANHLKETEIPYFRNIM